MAITWQQVKQITKLWGIEVTIQIEENGSPVLRKTMIFSDEQQIADELSTRCGNAVNRFEIKRSVLNEFWQFLGNIEAQDILIGGIQAIRSSPDVTFAQAITWYDDNYPDAIWKASAFFDKAREFCREELGFVPTWEQFKTYVINNKFLRID